jgi:MoxR-like ATPase|tara:strand:+ start:80 stop:1369 length:1290 start_codon:yes stop_codon:yes gene_type:complete
MLAHLRWMLQKDALAQDMFLIGPPSPYRRWLAMQFCQLTQQEIEFVQLTRDTTESDLKQRREINAGDVLFVDQAPVRAAKEGRCLILDGVEKIERNVLPTINNLLENREMHLDDGTFMLSADRYDALVESGANMEGLIRVHPDFRVVALSLPVPPYPGSSLDPPLRSRFQARVVMPPSANTMLDDLLLNAPDLPLPMAKKLVTFVEGIRLVSEESGIGKSIPPFPAHALSTVGTILAQCELETDVVRVLARSYPYINPSMPKDSLDLSMVSLLKKAVNTYVGGSTKGHASHYTFPSFPQENENESESEKKMKFDPHRSTLTVDIGHNVQMVGQAGQLGNSGGGPSGSSATSNIVPLNSYPHLLLDMYQDHAAGCDLLVVGPKGGGKSVLCKHFASRLGYSPVLFSMYKDMTARDLLQRRTTNAEGNTCW